MVAKLKAAQKRVAEAAKKGVQPVRGDADKEVAGYRRQLRAHIRDLEKRALKGDAEDPDRIAAVKGLGAIVLAMYVAEHNLRRDIIRSIQAAAN